MWRSRTIFIILRNVSSLWACVLTATHSFRTPNSHFQSLCGSVADANLQKCLPSTLYWKAVLLLIIQLFCQHSFHPFVHLSIFPFSLLLQSLTLACRHSCSSLSFCLSFSCCSICLNLYYLCISAILLHQIKAAACNFLGLAFPSLPRIVKWFQSSSMSLVLERVFEWLLPGEKKKKAVVSVHVNGDGKAG